MDIRKAPFFRDWKFRSNPNCRVCGEGPSEIPKSTLTLSPQEVPEMTLESIRHHQASGDGQLVDIRSSAELLFGRLTGASHLHGKELEAFLAKPDTSGRPLVFHCKSGGRSRALVSQLIGEGWSEVYSLTGDWESWREQSGDSLFSY